MKNIWCVIAFCCVAVLVCIPANAKEQPSRFLEQDQLQFGMELAQAQKQMTDEKNWEIAYRIDTPSTNDIACRFKQDVMYLAQFYMGRCYSLEKRAVVSKDEALTIFQHYTEVLGPTPEITNSRDQKLLFGRWSLKDREIELTAYEHHTGEYMAIYTEFDPLVQGEAVRTRESELQSQPTTIDPITGKPVPLPQDPQAEGSGEGNGQNDGGQTGDEAGNKEAEKKPEGQDEKDDPPPPPPDDDDWLD